MDLTEKLKNCPKGVILYSPLFGKVDFERISENNIVCSQGLNEYFFYDDGKYYKKGECMLFPSKECRNWEEFKSTFPPFKINREFYGTPYYIITDSLESTLINETFCSSNDRNFETGNYFNSKEEVEYAIQKVEELLLSLRE